MSLKKLKATIFPRLTPETRGALQRQFCLFVQGIKPDGTGLATIGNVQEFIFPTRSGGEIGVEFSWSSSSPNRVKIQIKRVPPVLCYTV